MIKTPSDHLLDSLEELLPNDFEKFKFKLQNTSVEKDHSRIPRGQVQNAKPVKLANLMINHYGEENAVRLTLQVLRAINQNLLAEELDKAIGPEYLIQESGTDSSAMSCSFGENKSKGLKISDGLEGERQRQSGDGAVSLPANQHEAGKGSQKKPQSRRRDQKSSECLDVLGKPGARSLSSSSRRSPFPGKLQGEKGSPTDHIRRNASSLGRLQGLSSGSFTGSLGRVKSKIPEERLSSGQRRPRSLEFTIFSRERELLNPETLLSQEKMRSDHTDSAATPSEVATLDVGATVALEKGSRNPEHSMTGKPQDEAMYPLGRAQEGDPADGTYVHDSYRPAIGSEDLKTSGRYSPSCLSSQASPPVKNSGDIQQKEDLQMAILSPRSLPQCERHMKQVQLLFCEDDREPICLICSLSQEHRGHRVRPIEEAALEYKVKIQKQLEYVKELRKSGEEQRSQGDKKTAKFLKQTETQKQRIQHQIEQLYHILEQQEKFFVASFEDLNRTIGQVRETYSTQVSRDIALLDELIGELEAKQCQPEWELMQDIGVTLHRVKMVTVPKLWNTPLEVEKKIQLFYRKSEFVEKSMKYLSEMLRSEIDIFNVPELICARAHAANVILDAETAHPNLIFSNNLKSVRLGNKRNRLPDNPERFDSCIIALGLPSFFSGRHYWEVEVGNKTGWILGICKASMSRKGSMTLSPDNGYWVVIMMKRSEYQVSTIPPTRLQLREPPKRVGIFLDYKAGDISFYNVTNKSLIYAFTGFSSSEPLQPIFSPGTHDGGKNMDPLTICPVGDQEPH
uniref:pyrin n=1 Tax=Nyctereutes procyonoides TaxID=34880 RepID=UPI002443774A|nr:pyrin [Nyctereutes procyonoides]